ncbi:glycosyltransferase 61 family protein, partial [Rosenbergiella collisarenosi]
MNNLKVDFIPNGIILPFKKNDSWGLGGVVDNDFNYISSSGYQDWLSFGGKYEINLSDVLICNEEVIWMGKFNSHWGHFLLDDVSRLWFLLENYNNQIIAYVSEDNEITDNFLQFIYGLGIARDKLLRVSKPTRFKNIIIPECSKNRGVINPIYHDIFLKVRENILSSNSKKFEDLDIYLSRSSFDSGKNKEIGEKAIEDIFNKQGFKSIYPEKLTLQEQVILWNNARKIACLNGTIPLNILFTNERKDLIVLNKTSRRHSNLFDVIDITNSRGVVFINVFCSFYDKSVRYLGEGPFIFNNLDSLRDYFGLKNSKYNK